MRCPHCPGATDSHLWSCPNYVPTQRNPKFWDTVGLAFERTRFELADDGQSVRIVPATPNPFARSLN